MCDGVIDGDRRDPPETRGSLAVAPEGRRRGGATLQENRPSRCGRKKEGGATGHPRAGTGDFLFSFVFLFFSFADCCNMLTLFFFLKKRFYKLKWFSVGGHVVILFSETAFQVIAWGRKGKATLSWRTHGPVSGSASHVPS